MEESYDGAFKLNTARPSDGVWGEGLPNNALADVGGDEKGDARAKAIAVLQHLIEADDDDARKEQLQVIQSTQGTLQHKLCETKHECSQRNAPLILRCGCYIADGTRECHTWTMIKIALPTPSSRTSPYMPDTT